MDQARLRKICIIKIHITDTFLKHEIEKQSLWKFFNSLIQMWSRWKSNQNCS